MREHQEREHGHDHGHAASAHDSHAAAAPGRASRVDEEQAGGAHWEDLVAPDWEELSSAEGEHVLQSIHASPSVSEDEEHDDDGAELETEAEHEPEADAEETEAEGGVVHAKAAVSAAPVTAAKVSAKAAKKHKHHIAHSAYITSHSKAMRNFHYKPSAEITNTQSEHYGAPNTYGTNHVPKAAKKLLLSTISVDIDTVVGANPKTGVVLVFHKTHAKIHGKTHTVPSGDRTGWVKVQQLPPKARNKIAHHQHGLRKKLAHGKGSGHRAKLKGKAHQFEITNPDTISADYGDFPIRGSSSDGGTPLGAYTTGPRYGTDVVVGVWNPPGSGDGHERFGGTGGIRAFLPATDPNFRFRLTTVPHVTVWDKKGTHWSKWCYVEARLGGQQIYCWLLQSWTSPNGPGHNFRV
jgi:hypothetical protein